MITKYDFEFPYSVINFNKKRLINQLWKLIPMYENGENWSAQLDNVIIEISGLYKIFLEEPNFLILLSKLEALKDELEFASYRKVVFESISLLGDLLDE